MFKKEVPTVILSGGKSRRMDGNDKAFISIGDQTLLEMMVKRLERQTSEIAINTNSNSHRYTGLGLPILNDEINDFVGEELSEFELESLDEYSYKRKYVRTAGGDINFPTCRQFINSFL